LNGNATSEAIVEVFATHDGWSNEQITKALKDYYTIELNIEDGKLYATANQKTQIRNWNTQGVNVSFKVSVSGEIDSYLTTSGGSIGISNLSGSQDAITSGGSITSQNCDGKIKLRTSGGSIEMNNLSGNIRASTYGGRIEMNSLSGNICASTNGGKIEMNNLSGNIHAATSGGSVTANNISGFLKTGTSGGGNMKLDNISGSLDAKTSGGTMNVTMLSVSDYVKLENDGNINLTLPADQGYNLKIKVHKLQVLGDLKTFIGKMDKKSMNGTVGNGGAEIEITKSCSTTLNFEL
jgi:predicted transcriptional regulator